jgi:hypothetical protein
MARLARMGKPGSHPTPVSVREHQRPFELQKRDSRREAFAACAFL